MFLMAEEPLIEEGIVSATQYEGKCQISVPEARRDTNLTFAQMSVKAREAK